MRTVTISLTHGVSIVFTTNLTSLISSNITELQLNISLVFAFFRNESLDDLEIFNTESVMSWEVANRCLILCRLRITCYEYESAHTWGNFQH